MTFCEKRDPDTHGGEVCMTTYGYPKVMTSFAEVDMPIDGVHGYLSQSVREKAFPSRDLHSLWE